MHSEDNAPKHLRARYPRFKTLGITGTQLSGGTISGYEQNTSLTGLSWVRAAEEMLRTDPVVRRSWHMLRQTLLSATWRFEAGLKMIQSLKSLHDMQMKPLDSMVTQVKCLSHGRSNSDIFLSMSLLGIDMLKRFTKSVSMRMEEQSLPRLLCRPRTISS
jgi:hypothetical protein